MILGPVGLEPQGVRARAFRVQGLGFRVVVCRLRCLRS